MELVQKEEQIEELEKKNKLHMKSIAAKEDSLVKIKA